MSNLWAPRLGYVFDLGGNGKTVVKANYGFYWHNPGVVISQNANPNIASKSVTYNWNDQAVCAGCISGDKRWQPGEQVGNPTAQALAGAVRLNPDIKAPYSHEASVFVERQVTQTMGARVGYVYKTQNDVISNDYQLDRPISAYTTPFTFVDIGVDAVRGTADDRNLTMFGVSTADQARFPTTRYVTNNPEFGRYKTVEASVNKRYGNKWSSSFGFGYTWSFDYPNGYPEHAESADHRRSHGVGIQGVGQLRCAVRHPSLADSAASVGRQFRANRDHRVSGRFGPRGVGRHAELWTSHHRQFRDLDLPRSGEREPRGQHLGGRHARREDLQVRPQPAIPRVRRFVQHHQQPRVRDHRPRDRHHRI